MVKVIINIKFSFKPVLQSIWFLLPIVRHSDDQVQITRDILNPSPGNSKKEMPIKSLNEGELLRSGDKGIVYTIPLDEGELF